jgi:general secretion pathway protein K
LPGGDAVAMVRDGGNCFNLNSVVSGQAAQALVVRPTGVAQFVALMQSLGIGQGEAQKVAASLADWVDTDTAEQPGGAEDAAYAGAETPYRTANTLVADPSELRAVAGVTPELYETVRPWVCALPITDLSPLNVNTLSFEQAPLLAMLLPSKLTPEAARAVLQRRPAGGFESGYAFGRMLAEQGIVLGEGEAQIGVKTRWFGLRLQVRLGDTEFAETALIDAGILPARLVRRSWGDES